MLNLKKLLSILVLGLLLSGNAYAGRDIQKEIFLFNKWLYDNKHYELVEKVDNEKCKSFDKGDTNWYYNNCDQPSYKSNLDLIFYDRFWIPEENPKPKPNYGTFVFELYRYLNYHETDSAVVGKYLVKRSDDPYTFQSNLIEDKYIDKQLNKSGLLSYLYFENGEIKIDKISPKNRFGKFIDDDTKFRSMSVGKTMVSYVVGHAICEGYIESIDSKVNDWPLVENTLYHNQKLIDLLSCSSIYLSSIKFD